jgi:hypothetical protein
MIIYQKIPVKIIDKEIANHPVKFTIFISINLPASQNKYLIPAHM